MNRRLISSLVLGTVQLGTNYGITNQSGKPSRKRAKEILELAWDMGVRCFDTAPTYGSEEIIGEFCSSNQLSKEIRILTKVAGFSRKNDWKGAFERSIVESLKRTQTERIETIFLHDSREVHLIFDNHEYFAEILNKYPVNTIGVSIYEPWEIAHLRELPNKLAFQFPFSVIDQRFLNVPMNIGRRYARSIFLQGILASKRLIKDVPDGIKDLHTIFHSVMRRHDYDPLVFSLEYVRRSSACDYILVGVDNIDQLSELFRAWGSVDGKEIPYSNILLDLSKQIDNYWIDPRNWSEQVR
jgi:aryl-alcohol dehydrogenase-like predicted oxidoreductase